MTTDLTARITEILREHQFWHCNHASIGSEDHCRCGDRPRGIAQWNTHVVALIAEAVKQHYRPRIETVEQLDALPEFSIVGLRMPKRDNVSRHLYAIEKDCGWLGVASADDLSRTEIASMLAAEDPAVVLWTPGAGE